METGKVENGKGLGPALAPPQPMAVTSELIAEIVKGILAGQKAGETTGMVDGFDKLDPEDIIEPPEVWYAPFANYVISTDKKAGREVSLPFKMPYLIFKHHASSLVKKPNTKESEIMNFSRLVVSSKVLSRWLENSSFYKVAIFRELKGAQHVDNKLTMLIQKYIHAFSGKDQGAMVNEASKLKIPIDGKTSLQDLKIAVASQYALEEWKRTVEATANRVLNQRKEAQLLGSDAEKVDDIKMNIETTSIL